MNVILRGRTKETHARLFSVLTAILGFAASLVVCGDASAVTSLVPAWQQKWSATVSGGYGDPLAARELADGSVLVFATSGAAVRYDVNGSVLSAAVISPPFFTPVGYNTPAPVYPSIVAIDAQGRIFVASTTNKLGFPSTPNGDIWLSAYDGTTGGELWAAPAVIDGPFHRSDRPTQLELDPSGNPIVIGFEDVNGAPSVALVAKFDRSDGSVIWGPTVLSGACCARAVVLTSGDVVLAFTDRFCEIRGSDGGFAWGPVPGGADLVGPSLDGGFFAGTTVSGTKEVRKYDGVSGSVVWGPFLDSDSSTSLQELAVTPAGHVVVLVGDANGFTVRELDGASGGLLWGPANRADAGRTGATSIRITAPGDVVVSEWSRDAGLADHLNTWKLNGGSGAALWGPAEFPSVTYVNLPPALAVRAGGAVLEAASSAGALKSLQRLPATGAASWGPTGFTASFPVNGILADITSAADGSVYVTGYASFPGNSFRWVTLKYDRVNGTILWGPIYADGLAPSPILIRTDEAGNAFVLGYDPVGNGAVVLKYDSATGTRLWISDPIAEEPRSLAVDASGNVFVLGDQYSGTIKVTKLGGSDGSVLWGPVPFAPPPPGQVNALRIAVDGAGDVVVAGNEYETAFGFRWLALKLSGGTGTLLWGPVYLGTVEQNLYFVWDLVLDGSGNAILTGDATAKLDGATGAVRWGPLQLIGSNAAVVDSHGDVFTAGEIADAAGISADYAVVKHRGSDGAVLWGPVRYDGPAGNDDQAAGIASDGAGNPVVVGASRNSFLTFDVATLVFDTATGASLGAPAIIDGFRGHRQISRHAIVASGGSVVVAATGESFETTAYQESSSAYCDPDFPPPVASVASGAACDGQTVQLQASGYPGATYSWTGPVGFVSSLRTPTVVASSSTAGTYTVAVQAYGCMLPPASVELVVHSPLSAAMTVSLGGQTASVPDAGPGAAYNWSITWGSISSGQGTGSIQFSIPSNQTAVLTVTVTNSNGCSASSSQALFTDVPAGPAASFISRLFVDGVTAGCGAGLFCPSLDVSRAQMAVFLLRSKNGPSYTPPAATGTVFTDVPVGGFAAAWIEALAAADVAAGCGGGKYCPDASVTRAQMAVFLLRTLHGSGFAPPPATGTVFADVPASSFAAAWIERLSGEGFNAGCGGGNFCPSATVSRAQMAVFLVSTFGLP